MFRVKRWMEGVQKRDENISAIFPRDDINYFTSCALLMKPTLA